MWKVHNPVSLINSSIHILKKLHNYACSYESNAPCSLFVASRISVHHSTMSVSLLTQYIFNLFPHSISMFNIQYSMFNSQGTSVKSPRPEQPYPPSWASIDSYSYSYSSPTYSPYSSDSHSSHHPSTDNPPPSPLPIYS